MGDAMPDVPISKEQATSKGDGMSAKRSPGASTRREFLKATGGAAAGLALASVTPTKGVMAGTPARSTPAAGKVTLVWWTSLAGAVAKALESLARTYNEKNPNVLIKVENQGTGYPELRDKMMAAAAARQLPDLVLMGNAFWVPFARNNLFEALDDYIKGPNGVDLKDYFPFVNRGMINGKYYQLPIPVSAPLFYYNVDMVKAAGIPMPTEKWTWDDHYNLISKLTVKERGKVKVYGHAYRVATWNQQQEIWAYGSQMSDDKYNVYLDTPPMIAQWKRWQKASAAGENHIPTKGEGTTLEMFATTTVATTWASTGSLQRFEDMVKGRFKWSVLAAPYGPKGRFAAEGGGGIHIVAGLPKEKRDAAWGFVKYTQEPEQVAFFAKSTGYLAFTNKAQALMSDFLKENPLFRVAYEALASGGRKSEPFNDSARAQTLVFDTLDNLAVGTKDVETTLKQLQKEATAVMIEEGYLKK